MRGFFKPRRGGPGIVNLGTADLRLRFFFLHFRRVIVVLQITQIFVDGFDILLKLFLFFMEPSHLSSGQIKPNRIREMGGLKDVITGFKEQQEGRVSAEKLVYKIA